MPSLRWMHPAAAALLAAAALNAGPAGAGPYLPRDPAQVLERVPARADPAQRAVNRLRARLRLDPANAPLAAGLARHYLELARQAGDPRYLGYAQAALAPWWSLPRPPAEVLLLRATIRQSTHQFAAALADLNGLVLADPGNAQAWLIRATVQQVTGDFAGARGSCARLDGIASRLVSRACLAGVDSVNGAAEASYHALLAARAEAGPVPDAIEVWVLTQLGEMAARLGRAHAARLHFAAALALAPGDNYLLGAYADFLLDQGEAEKAAELLRSREASDGLLLRRAIALARLGSPQAPAARVLLSERMRAAALRGDTLHQREQARQALHLDHDPARALQLARANWAVQKEPADIRILLEAALATGDRQSIAEARAWIGQARLEDATLARLRARASGASTGRRP